jgi:hypothetical protein
VPWFELFDLDKELKDAERKIRHDVKNKTQHLILENEELEYKLKEKGINVLDENRNDPNRSFMDSTVHDANIDNSDVNKSKTPNQGSSENKTN